MTETRVETQAASATQHSVAITEDNKGRVTGRDYTPNISGLVDSYFVYDGQDRVLCERTTAGSTCPTSYGGEKNNHYSGAATPFTAAGDWKTLWRPIVGSTGWIHTFRLITGTHQTDLVGQSNGTPTFGNTQITYDSRGNRSSDDNTTSLTNDQRTYTYDTRRNLANVAGKYYSGPFGACGNQGQPLCWSNYAMASAFDAMNRRVYKSFYRAASNTTATWFFYYDALSRLAEVRYTPNTASPATYSVFQLIWLGDQLVAYWQTDYPSVTTSKRYVGRDESGRPIDMMSWPSSGDATREWAINPDAWGVDTLLVGGPFQPILFAGQYQDSETTTSTGGALTPGNRHRPGLVLNGFRTYDPWTGSYLQVDPLVDSSWSSYVYVNSDPLGKIDPDGLLSISVKVTASFGNNFWTTGEVGCWSLNTGIEASECLAGYHDPWGEFGFPDSPFPRPRRPHCETHPTDPDCHDYALECNVCELGCNVIFELEYCDCVSSDPSTAEIIECASKANMNRRDCLFDCIAGPCLTGGLVDLGDQEPPLMCNGDGGGSFLSSLLGNSLTRRPSPTSTRYR